MKGKVFLDSNVILYAYQESEEKQKIARFLMSQENSIISNQVIAEVSYNLIKKPFYTSEEIRTVTNEFYNSFQIMNNSQTTFLKAINIREQFSFSFWDSLILASAIESGSEVLYSEDMQDNFSIEGVKISNPFKAKIVSP
jgi:predicted nucleic acid-binding protein